MNQAARSIGVSVLVMGLTGGTFAAGSGNAAGGQSGNMGNAHGAATAGPTSGGDPASGPKSAESAKMKKGMTTGAGSAGASTPDANAASAGKGQ
jgi:hypothetical protein